MREKDIVMEGGVAGRPGKRKKHLKPYTTLYESNFRDVSKTLRQIAKEVETGKYGGVDKAALVLDTESGKFLLYGFGPHVSGLYDTLALFDLACGELRGNIFDRKAAQEAAWVPREPPKKDD